MNAQGKIIAIMGMPRTGSTLMRQVLIASGQVAMPHDVPEGFFGELAKSYWSAWEVSRQTRTDWIGDEAFNTDIQEVNPWMSESNVCAAADMSRLRSLYRYTASYMLNTTCSKCPHVGIKNVRDTGVSMLAVTRFLLDLYQDERFKAIHMVRHPFTQLRSECNASWSPVKTNSQAIRVFMKRLKKWKTHSHCLNILVGENPKTCIVHYEDRNNDFRKAVSFTGMDWTPEMSAVLGGEKLNPSKIRFPLNEKCFDAAHEAYVSCDLVANGHGPACLDNIKDLVR